MNNNLLTIVANVVGQNVVSFAIGTVISGAVGLAYTKLSERKERNCPMNGYKGTVDGEVIRLRVVK